MSHQVAHLVAGRSWAISRPLMWHHRNVSVTVAGSSNSLVALLLVLPLIDNALSSDWSGIYVGQQRQKIK